MNTTDLPAMIRQCVDGGTQPISLGEIKARATLTERRERPVPVRRATRLGLAAVGLAAAGVAGVLVASQVGGGTAAGPRVVLTATMLKQVADASQAAMTSGRADIVTATGGSTLVQQVSFDGANYSDVINPGESITKVVSGHFYHYPAVSFTPAPHPVPEWMRIIASGAVQSYSIPDPRTLLSVLSPSAGFAADGHATVNGVRAEHLRATTPGAVPLQPLNPLIGTEPDTPRVSALDLWVGPSDVVLKAQFTITGSGTVSVLTAAGTRALHQYANQHGMTISAGVLQNRGALTAWASAQAAAGNAGVAGLLRQPGMVTTQHITDRDVTVTVTFSQIGQPQDITPPAHYITLGGKG